MLTFALIALLGTILGLAAGGVQELREEDGVFLGDFYRLLFWRTDHRATLHAAGRITATVTLQAISGSIGFTALAIGHTSAYTTAWMNRQAARASQTLTFTPEV